MQNKRVLSWILAFIMLFQCAYTGSVMAENETAKIAYESFTYINPYYADVMKDYEFYVPDGAYTINDEEAPERITDWDTAGNQIRESMIDRQEQFTLYLDISDLGLYYAAKGTAAYTEMMAQLNSLANDLFGRAMVHTPNTPNGGDYLKFTFGGAEVKYRMYMDSSDKLTQLDVTYYTAYYTNAEEEAAVDEEVAWLVNNWNLMGLDAHEDDSDADYAAASAIYSFICDRVVYDYENLENDENNTKYTAYGALINGTSVCQGYANLFYRLALEMGLDARVIAGTGNGGDHAWNIVKIGDYYYNLDATWDEPRYKNDIKFEYYLTTDSFDESHSRDAEFNSAEFNAAHPMADADYFTYAEESGEVNGKIILEEPGYDLEYMKDLVSIETETAGELDTDGSISWSLANGELRIDGIGEIVYEDPDELPWAEYKDSIRKVNVGYGITAVGDRMFENYRLLHTVDLAGSVSDIGQNAFNGCSSLMNLNLNLGLRGMGMNAFAASALRWVRLPRSLENYGWAFSGTPFLEGFELFGEGYHFETAEENVLISADGSEFFHYPAGRRETSYVMPSSIERLAIHCIDMTDLEGLRLSRSLRIVDAYAVTENFRLTELAIPASVEEISEGAFLGNSSLREVYFYGDYSAAFSADLFADAADDLIVYYPAGNESWNACTWETDGLYNLESFDAGILDEGDINGIHWEVTAEGVLNITGEGDIPDYWEFWNGDYPEWYELRDVIHTVNIGEGIYSVGGNALRLLENAAVINLPGSLNRIGGFAFAESAVEELYIPANVECIEDSVCWGCQNFSGFTVDENNPWYTNDTCGVLFDGMMTELIEYPLARTKETYEVPSGVRTINPAAFENEQDLTSVILNEGLQFIRDSAFYGVNLTELVIPKTVKHIENWAFNTEGTLTSVVFEGAYPEYFGECVFYSEDEPIPEAFCITANKNMPDWDQFTEGVLTADNNPDYPLEFVDNAIENFAEGTLKNGMTWVIDLDGTLYVNGEGEMPWYDWGGENEFPWKKYARYITAIVISDDIIDVSAGAFADLYNAESLTLPDTMEWIHDEAFHYCESLTKVSIPAGVQHIAGNAFTCNFSVTAFEVDEANEWYESDETGVLYNESMDQLMFYPVGRTDITDYTIPGHVYVVNDQAFRRSKLISVTFEDGVAIIGHEAFAESEDLFSVLFGSTVSELNNYAFANCPSLVEAIFEGPMPVGDFWGIFNETHESFKVMYPANAGWVVDEDDMWWINSEECYPAEAYDVENPVIYSGEFNGFKWTLTNAGVLTVSGEGELPQFHDDVENGGFGGEAPWHSVRSLIREIVVEDGITALGHRSFADLDYVQNLELPGTLVKLYNASIDSTQLPELHLPASLQVIENGAISSMWNLHTITADGCEAYKVVDGVLYNADMTELILYPNRKEGDAFDMPDTVTAVYASAFKASELSSITLSDNLESIGSWAFAHNETLNEIHIPAKVNYIASCAFYDCRELRNAWFCSVPPIVENDIFEQTPEDFTVHYPSNISGWNLNDEGKWQPDWNRPYNAEGYEVELPDGPCEVGELIVDDTVTGGWSFDWDGTLTFWGYGYMPAWDWGNEAPWYKYAPAVTKVVFAENNGFTGIGRHTFRDCVNLTSIELPKWIEVVEDEAFIGCSNLKNITLNEGLKEIWHAAFQDASPDVIELPASVEFIDHGAFKFCHTGAFAVSSENEWFYTDEEGVLYRWENDDKSEFSLVAYPIGRTDDDGRYEAVYGISGIYNHAFAGSSLTEIVIPDSVNNIGSWAFEWSEQLETAYLPMGLVWISDNTFHGCMSLQNLYFRSAPPAEIWHGAFEGVEDTLTVYYPDTISVWDEVVVNGEWTYTTPEGENGETESRTFKAEPYDAQLPEYLANGVEKVEERDEEGNVTGYHEITWYITWNGELHVLGEGSTPDWDWEYPAPWYAYRDYVNKIVVHDGIIRIGGMNFVHLNCEVELSETVTELAPGAFTDCGNLGTIRLSKNMAYVFPGAFSGSIVDAFDVDDANPFYFDENDVLIERNSIFAKYMDEQPEGSVEVEINGEKAYVFNDIWLLIAYPSGREADAYTLPSNVIYIAEMAFANTQNLTEINLNPELLYISQHAFSNCGQVTEMIIPANVREVGRNFINGWETLEKVTFEGSAPLFDDPNVFEGCSRDMVIYYPEGFDSWDQIITYTEEDGYRWNITYTNWETPEHEEYVVSYRAVPVAAADTGKLAENLFWEITDEGVLRVWGDGAIRNYNDEFCAPWTPRLADVTAISVEPDKNGSISIGTFAFRNCGDINFIHLGEGVTKINSYAFADCILPIDYVQSIPSTAIIEWSAFACVDINRYEMADNSNGYTTEEDGAFLYYTDAHQKVLLDAGNDVTEVWLPEGVNLIASGAFDRCMEMTTLMIPASIQYIGASVFDACLALEEVYFMGARNENLVIENDSLFGEAGNNVTVRFPKYAKDGWMDLIDSRDDHNFSWGLFIHGGDVNSDLKVDADDALLLSRYFAGSLTGDDSIYLQGADVDGTYGLTRKDAMVLNRWVAGWDVKFERIIGADE